MYFRIEERKSTLPFFERFSLVVERARRPGEDSSCELTARLSLNFKTFHWHGRASLHVFPKTWLRVNICRRIAISVFHAIIGHLFFLFSPMDSGVIVSRILGQF